jgi:hypothetical protein
MKQGSYLNICRYSAKRIKNLLNTSKNQLLSHSSSLQERNDTFPATHKCDHIKLSQILGALDKFCVQELQVSKLKCPEFLDKQRSIQVPNCNGVPLTALDQNAVSTQCCINQKHVNHFFLFEGKNGRDPLSGRHIQRRFREYLLAYKQLKNISQQASPNARKYQIALLKDENVEEAALPPIDWIPIKMEERHFLMGYTIKHPH